MQVIDHLRLARRHILALLGHDVSHRAELQLPVTRFGTAYGGWVLFTGNLTSDSVVYSFGVGEDASFDTGLIEEYGVDVYAFDPTPKAIEWVATGNLPSSFRFSDIGIADFDGTATFNAPQNPQFASYTLTADEGDATRAATSQVRRLSTIMADLGHQYIDVLKLDIEGAEYSVISDFLEEKVDVGQLLVEFHHAFKSVSVQQTNDAVDLLRRNGFRLYHVSPRGEDYSFIHRSRLLQLR